MEICLSDVEINKRLSRLQDWVYEDGKITKKFKFKSFRAAMVFLIKLSYEAEQLNHHPEIYNCYNFVEISLNTHGAGGKVTEKDFLLAFAIDSTM